MSDTSGATSEPQSGSDELRGSACLVCSGTYEASARLPGLVRCVRCAFVSANTRLADADLRALYGRDYFHGHEYLDYEAERESLQLNFALRLKTLERLIADLPARDLLEVGCAYGYFLDLVRPMSRSATGVDIAEHAVEAAAARGHDARPGSYLEMDFDRKFGVVTMWDTIEHLARPDLFVAKAARDLEQGGYLVLTTGDIGSLNARLRGRRWRMIHPPTHLHYFSVPTLTKLLTKNGFDVVHVEHPGVSRTLRSIAYAILSLRMQWHGAYERMTALSFLDRGITLNLNDIMFVVARRR